MLERVINPIKVKVGDNEFPLEELTLEEQVSQGVEAPETSPEEPEELKQVASRDSDAFWENKINLAIKILKRNDVEIPPSLSKGQLLQLAWKYDNQVHSEDSREALLILANASIYFQVKPWFSTKSKYHYQLAEMGETPEDVADRLAAGNGIDGGTLAEVAIKLYDPRRFASLWSLIGVSAKNAFISYRRSKDFARSVSIRSVGDDSSGEEYESGGITKEIIDSYTAGIPVPNNDTAFILTRERLLRWVTESPSTRFPSWLVARMLMADIVAETTSDEKTRFTDLEREFVGSLYPDSPESVQKIELYCTQGVIHRKYDNIMKRVRERQGSITIPEHVLPPWFAQFRSILSQYEPFPGNLTFKGLSLRRASDVRSLGAMRRVLTTMRKEYLDEVGKHNDPNSWELEGLYQRVQSETDRRLAEEDSEKRDIDQIRLREAIRVETEADVDQTLSEFLEVGSAPTLRGIKQKARKLVSELLGRRQLHNKEAVEVEMARLEKAGLLPEEPE